MKVMALVSIEYPSFYEAIEKLYNDDLSLLEHMRPWRSVIEHRFLSTTSIQPQIYIH